MTITVDRVGELKYLMIELLWPFVFALCSIVKRGKRDTLTYPDSCITWFHFSLLFYLLLRKRFIFSILIELNWRTENRFKTHQGRYFNSEPGSYVLWIVSYYHNVFISGLQSPEIFAHRGVVTFHANAAFYAWRSPAGYTGNSLPVG